MGCISLRCDLKPSLQRLAAGSQAAASTCSQKGAARVAYSLTHARRLPASPKKKKRVGFGFRLTSVGVIPVVFLHRPCFRSLVRDPQPLADSRWTRGYSAVSVRSSE